MQLLLQFYPAIITTFSLFCYKNDNAWMRTFCHRMVFSFNFRKLFVLSLLFMLLTFNFSYMNVYGLTTGFYGSTAVCMCLFFFNQTEKFFFEIQDRPILGVILLVTLLFACFANTWAIAMNLYVVIVGSIFYPSKHLFKKIGNPNVFSRIVSNPEAVTLDYYAH